MQWLRLRPPRSRANYLSTHRAGASITSPPIAQACRWCLCSSRRCVSYLSAHRACMPIIFPPVAQSRRGWCARFDGAKLRFFSLTTTGKIGTSLHRRQSGIYISHYFCSRTLLHRFSRRTAVTCPVGARVDFFVSVRDQKRKVK